MNANCFLAVALIFVLSACTSTRITHSWKAKEISPSRYKKILVVALNGDKDVRSRERMEDHLAGDLEDAGYNAITSTHEYGPKAFYDMNDDEMINKLQNSGIDAVLTIVLLDKSREKYYVPGRVYYSPYVIYHRHFPGYYMTMYNRIHTPGYYTANTRYFWESNFYDISSKELLYSVQTESFDQASMENLAHEYGKVIVNDMVKNKILIK